MHYCSKCQYKSISEYNLKRHTRHSHSDQRFSCDRCEYSAKDAYSVKLHKKVHEGILNNCDQCTYSSPSTQSLKCHKLQRIVPRLFTVINVRFFQRPITV